MKNRSLTKIDNERFVLNENQFSLVGIEQITKHK